MTKAPTDSILNPGPAHHTGPHPPAARVAAADAGLEPTDVELDSERQVLGAMMTPLWATGADGVPQAISSPQIAEVRRVVGADQFVEPAHRMVAAAIFAMVDRGDRGINTTMVAHELEVRGQLAKIGGLPAVNRLFAAAATATNAAYHADMVRAAANRRATYHYALRVTQVSMTAHADSGELFDRVTTIHERYLAEVRNAAVSDIVSIGNRTDMLAEVAANWGYADTASGFTTGLYDLDAKLNTQDGAMVVVAGRPGSGKSILADKIAWHYVAERGEIVQYHSLEMPAPELIERGVARNAGLRLDSATGKTPVTELDRRRIAAAVAEYETLGTALFVDDTPDVTMEHVEARYEEIKSTAGRPGLVVIDYVQLVKAPRAENRQLAIAELSRRCKVFGQRTGSTALLLAQLNRGPEARPNGVPVVSDLRESGGIEQDADAVLLVHPVGDYDDNRTGEVDIIIGKQRRGGRATVAVSDARAYADFRNLTRQAAPRAARAAIDAVTDLDALENGTDSEDRNGDDFWRRS